MPASRVSLGGQLLAAAGLTCLQTVSEADGVLLVMDAKGRHAAPWYASYGSHTSRSDAHIVHAVQYLRRRSKTK